MNPNIAFQLISIQLECSICSLYCRIFHPASYGIAKAILFRVKTENYSTSLPQLCWSLFLSLLELLKPF